MALHGFEVKLGKPTPYVPPPEKTRVFLKQAALPPDAPKDARASLMIKSEAMETELCLGTLSKKGVEHMCLELTLDEYVELSIKGNCSVHVIGIALGAESDEDEEFDPEQLEQLAALKGLRFGGDSDSDDEDDDDYNESDDSDIPRLEELPIEEKKPLANGKKKKQPIVEPPSSSDDDSDDDDDVMDDDDSDDESLPQPTPPKPQGKQKNAKGKQQQQQKQKADPTPSPPPQQKATGKQQKGSKRDGGELENTPKRSKTGEGAKQKQVAPSPVSTGTTSPANTASTGAPTPTPSPLPGKKKDTRRFKNGFVIHNTKYGNPDGKVSRKGKTLVVSYVGKLANGQVFDKTKGKSSFEFVLGAGQVIKGWDKGLEDMRVGDKRRLTVPPSMGYGAAGSPPAIPPNSTLTFDVSLENVK